MKTKYSNTSHPLFIKWSSIAAGILSAACFVAYVLVDKEWGILFYIMAMSFLYFIIFFTEYKLVNIAIDEENDTITDSRRKKYPMHISKLTTVTYKESKKGKFRSIFFHDDGVGFMDIRTSKSNADKMVAQLLKANPSIEVKHANYL